MPNNITNHITVSGNAEDIKAMFDAVSYDNDYGMLDFNKVIPMPTSLDMESGSLTTRSVEVYMSVINPDNPYFHRYYKVSMEKFIELKVKIIHDGNYYFLTDKRYEFMLDGDKINGDWQPLYELGRLYVSNLINYGAFTWYDWRLDNWGTKWNSYASERKENSFIFETAWSAPHEIVEQLAKMFPRLSFYHEWADENIGYNTGYCEYYNGERWNECFFDDGTKDAYEFAAEVLETDLAEYDLYFNEAIQNYEVRYDD